MRNEGFGNLSKRLAQTEGRRSFQRRKDWKRGERCRYQRQTPTKEDQVF